MKRKNELKKNETKKNWTCLILLINGLQVKINNKWISMSTCNFLVYTCTHKFKMNEEHIHTNK